MPRARSVPTHHFTVRVLNEVRQEKMGVSCGSTWGEGMEILGTYRLRITIREQLLVVEKALEN